MTVVAFTGHRPNKLGGYYVSNKSRWVRQKLREVLLALRPTAAISGMALGVDLMAARLCFEMDIPYTAAIPFEGQELVWPSPNDREEHYDLRLKATRVVVVSKHGYTPRKMSLRNEWMVDRCSRLVAVWDGSRGGTYNCVKYAEKVGVPVTHIDPRDYDLGL